MGNGITPSCLSATIVDQVNVPPALTAGTLWELSIKVGLRTLRLSLPYRQWMVKAIADLGLPILPITVDYAEIQAGLPQHHRDPFDRLIVAQALVEGIPIISADPQLDACGVSRIW